MTDHAAAAKQLAEALALCMPPIAVGLADAPPEGVPAAEGSVPAGCAFWERAAKGAFATTAADHARCAIGLHTHAMALDEAAQTDLQDALAVFADLGYVRPEEVPGIPVLKKPTACVVYGPLGDPKVSPDVVLLFADARQSLIITEAAQQVSDGAPPALGRPACAIVPQVVNTGAVTLSLGCCGARAYLDALTDDVALWGIPAGLLERFTERVVALAGANRTLGRFHELRRGDVEAGGSPSIKQSLARLQESASR